jgi:putative membrane protein
MLGGLTCLLPKTARAQSDTDKQFLSTVSQSDVNEIKLSQLAEKKASDPGVKSFARKMVADHTRLSASMKPFAAKLGLTPPTDLDDEHRQAYDKLNGLSGANFDKEYMDLMVADHHKALDLFTEEEKSSTSDAKFHAAVQRGKTIVASHTKMADELQKKV